MRRRDVITLFGGVAAGWPQAARAQQAGTILHIGMVEPISAELNAGNLAAFRRGLLLVVASLARPGGNITGLSGVVSDLDAKRIELLQEMAPATSRIVAVLNMSNPITVAQVKELEPAARSKGLAFRLFDVRNRDDIERAFSSLTARNNAMVVGLDGVTQAHARTIAELAAKHGPPAIYGGREFVEVGGLMFYGPSFAESYRRAATYVGKIMNGAKPADLPIEQPSTLELVIHREAAKSLGLAIPPSLLARADEVID